MHRKEEEEEEDDDDETDRLNFLTWRQLDENSCTSITFFSMQETILQCIFEKKTPEKDRIEKKIRSKCFEYANRHAASNICQKPFTDIAQMYRREEKERTIWCV